MKILNLTKRHCYSLYIDGNAVEIPSHPAFDVNDSDVIGYVPGMEMVIGPDDPDPRKLLTWFVATLDNGQELWFCDRVLVKNISRAQMERLAEHQEMEIAGKKMVLSIPEQKDGYSEWNLLMWQTENEPANSAHRWYRIGTVEKSGDQFVLRGYKNAYASKPFNFAGETENVKETDRKEIPYGWRPVLRRDSGLRIVNVSGKGATDSTLSGQRFWRYAVDVEGTKYNGFVPAPTASDARTKLKAAYDSYGNTADLEAVDLSIYSQRIWRYVVTVEGFKYNGFVFAISALAARTKLKAAYDSYGSTVDLEKDITVTAWGKDDLYDPEHPDILHAFTEVPEIGF